MKDLRPRILALALALTAVVSISSIAYAQEIEATVDLHPRNLNLRSFGRWLTCYIELPEGYDVEEIDISSVELQIRDDNANILYSDSAKPWPTQVGDEDEDGIPDLMVKFGRRDLVTYLKGLEEIPREITLTVTGAVADGTFLGTDTLRVKVPKKTK